MWTGGGIAASSAAMFGVSLLLIGTTSTGAFADTAILTALVSMFGTLARFGADRMVVAEVHGADSQGGIDHGHDRGADLIGLSILTGALGGLAIFLPFVSRAINHALSNPLSMFERVALAIWFVSEVVRFVVAEAHRARYRFRWAALSSSGVRAPLYLILLIGLGVARGRLPRDLIIAAASFSSLIVCLVSIGAVSPTFRWWRAHPIRSGRRLLAGHVSMVLTTFAASLIGGVDVWILGSTMSDDVTATYALAVTLTAGLAMLGAAITGGVAPYLAAALANGRHTQIQSEIIKLVRLSSVIVVVIYFALVVLVKPLASTFGGKSYAEVTIFVAILGAGQILNSLAGIAGTVLIVARRYSTLMAVTVGVSLVAVGLEVVAGFGFHSALMVAVVSGAATGILPIVGSIVLFRLLGLRSDAFGHRPT